MPKSFGGIIGWAFSTILIVAVGLFIISRIPPLWRIILPSGGAQ